MRVLEVSWLPVVALLAVPACTKVDAAVPPTAGAAAEVLADAKPAGESIGGKVVEKIDAGQYSYLKLKTASREIWAAVPKTDKAVGDAVTIAGAMWMRDFESKTLNRTWPEIAFGTLDEAAAPQASPHGKKVAATVGDVRVARATGGRTIAEVYQSKSSLKDQRVVVRGKVTKATDGVLGKSWLHLADGTGQGPTADLTVASANSAAVGDIVLASGIVRVDRDLGSGYHFDVLLDEANVSKE